MRKKILVIVYNLEKAVEHELFAELIDQRKFEIHFALVRKCNSHLHHFLESKGVKVFCFDYAGKSSFPGLIFKLFSLIRREKYLVVHTHLFESSLAGLLAARIAGVKHRIVTRHHSDYHHEYFPKAVKFDKYINSLATHIVAISTNVRKILVSLEHVPSGKIILIPHGIRADDFHPNSISLERKAAIRIKYNLLNVHPVIGVVSRFISWKGIQYVIPAFVELKKIHPGAVLILANAQGPYETQVRLLLKPLNESDYRLVPFESDIPALYAVFDCFVHTPVTETAEAFGQAYIESLASGVPSVITRSGVAIDFAEDGLNCLVVPYRDSKAITRAIDRILGDSALANSLARNGFDVVRNNYNVFEKYHKLELLYDSLN